MAEPVRLHPDTEDIADPPECPPGLDLSRYVPPDWDLWEIDPTRIADQLERNIDPTYETVRIWHVMPQTGELARVPGEFPAETVTSAWLLQTRGAGRYEVRVLNPQKRHVVGKRIRLHETGARGGPSWAQQARPQRDDPPGAELEVGAPGLAAALGGSQAAQPGGAWIDQILQRLLMRALEPPTPPPDPMRSSIADITKLLTLSMQHQSQLVANRPSDSGNLELLKLLLPMLAQRNDNPQPSGAAMSIQEAMGILQMGMKMGEQLTGNQSTGDRFAEMLPGIIDAVGVPLVATLAASIKDPEQRDKAISAIDAHQAQRGREPISAQQDPPVDTTGENVIP